MECSISIEDSFHELKNLISNVSKNSNFGESCNEIDLFIKGLTKEEFLLVVQQIGTIPEQIEHDSTEEKLYSKASDSVLARCFRELGLNSKVLTERSDSADILANSIHKYSLVADAKSFRMSRTAKNQKDFKIDNLSNWRGCENEYAVLCSAYYQYPKIKSQIYAQALDKNVCLISWEHMLILLKMDISENANFSLESIWNSSKMLSRSNDLVYSNRKNNFLPFVNNVISEKIGCSIDEFNEELLSFKYNLIDRGGEEVSYWRNEICKIENYNKETAISELIKSKKLNEKIYHINDFIKKLRG